MDAGERATFAEIEEVAVVEKELGHDVVGAGIDLRLEVIHLDQAIWGRRMAFGETGHADPEAAAVGMRAGFVEFLDELHEVDRVLKNVRRFVVGAAPWRVTAEGEDVADRVLRVA